MIRHIVLFKLKEEATAEDKERLVNGLKELEHNTDGLMLECVVGEDVAGTPNSYDVGLNSLFESMETLDRYQVHPNHVAVLSIVKATTSSVTKIDYTA